MKLIEQQKKINNKTLLPLQINGVNTTLLLLNNEWLIVMPFLEKYTKTQVKNTLMRKELVVST